MNHDENDTLSRNGINPGKLSASKRDANAVQGVSSQRRCCNCKQSKCIKLYCECYAAGVYCNTACNCNDCWNNPNFEDHRKAAIQTTLEKNPSAFQPKISTPNFIEYKKAEPLNYGKHSKGCACKKSGCMKKYCECFQAGIPCSDLCKCADCHNTKEYYELNKKKIGSSIEVKEEDIPDANSFFFKFLLAANEGESNIANSNKNLGNKKLAHITQEQLERLYNKMYAIIDTSLDDYLKNKSYVKEVDRLNPSSIMFEKPSQEKTENRSSIKVENKPTTPQVGGAGIDIEEAPPKKDQDDLMCDENVELLKSEEVINKEGDMALDCKNEGQGELKLENNKYSDGNSDNSKYSFYKIKKNRILREFISVLRSIDS